MANSIVINDPLMLTDKANVSALYGPYASMEKVQELLADWDDPIPQGLTFGVIEDGKIREYWFKTQADCDSKTLTLKDSVELTSNGFKIGDYTFTIQ